MMGMDSIRFISLRVFQRQFNRKEQENPGRAANAVPAGRGFKILTDLRQVICVENMVLFICNKTIRIISVLRI